MNSGGQISAAESVLKLFYTMKYKEHMTVFLMEESMYILR